ncbi:MAG TPA: TetR/AcrR family transcriptional regulator [Spirochaetes bacterium]|nr:TetR/AcrR family transcriptional regulator [Spirochaetota bacterium]
MGIKERRIREKELRKEQILDAARTLVINEGLAATSVHRIAKLTELSVGTIYLYFSCKEEIFATLQEEGMDQLQRDISENIKDLATSAEKLRAMALAYLNFSQDHKKYFDIFNYFISTPAVLFPRQLKTRIDRHGSKILGIVEKSISDGIESGEFEAADTLNSALGYWATLHGLLQFRKLKNTIYKHENFEELYFSNAEFFITGLKKKTGHQADLRKKSSSPR